MTAFLVWSAVVWGFVVIVTQSRLFAPLRDLAARRAPPLGVLLHCSLCFGWWAGAGLSLAGLASPSALVCSSWPWWGRSWADGCASAAVCWGAHVVLARLGAASL